MELDGVGGIMFACYHLWKAGEIEAADAFFGDGRALQGPSSPRTAAFTRTDAVVGLYEALLAQRKRNGRSPAMLFPLRSALVMRGSNRRPDLAIYADETLQSLLHDIGFDLWDTLPDTRSDLDRVEPVLENRRRALREHTEGRARLSAAARVALLGRDQHHADRALRRATSPSAHGLYIASCRAFGGSRRPSTSSRT